MFRFVSKAAGDVWMRDELAKKLLEIIGKPASVRGVITPGEIPAAIAALRAAIEQDKRLSAAKPAQNRQDEAEMDEVSLSQRAFPLLDMLERSAKRKTDVLWGV